MDIFSLITLCGGLAFFLFGMSTMSSGLEKLAGGRLEQLLKRMTSNRFKSLLLGAGITIAIQSSSAMTVMLVGLVNSGIMQLGQTVGIIMGSNVGTTLTAWILSLSGIEGDAVWLKLLKPEVFSPVVALAGVILIMSAKRSRLRSAGSIMVGFAVLMTGMDLMKNAVSPLADMPEFASILTAFTNPFLGVVVGAVFTGIIQSSAASVGILQALSLTGGITYGMALPIIMGQNIGTCVTAILSSIGASRNAKRTAAVHLYFNIIGTLVFSVALYGLNAAVGLVFWNQVMDYGSIANLHSIFNIVCTLILLPFNRVLLWLVEKTIPETGQDPVATLLDPRFLATPPVALERCRGVVIQMGELAQKNLGLAQGLLIDYNEKQLAKIHENEELLDHMESSLDRYLVQLSSHSLPGRDSDLVSDLLHALTDFERIGDYAVNLSESATVLSEQKLSFSPSAAEELKYVCGAVNEALSMTVEAYRTRSAENAFRVEPLEEVVDLMTATLRERHVERLKRGDCTVELGTQFLELLTNLERISDHCSNAAVRVIQQASPHGALIRQDIHNYLQQLHQGGSAEFASQFEQAKERYFQPIAQEKLAKEAVT